MKGLDIVSFLTQSYGRLTYFDLLLIVTYMAICIYVGIKNIDKIRTIKDYALGGSSISTAALVATLYATHLGAGATIGTIERIAEVGMLLGVTVLLQPFIWVITLVIYRNVEQFRGCITPSDIMARLYDTSGRVVMNASILVASMGTVAAQTAALGYLLHYFLDIPVVVGVSVGAGTLILYSVLGGIRAVVVTDTFQFAMFYIILPALCGLFVYQNGGWSAVAATIPEDKWAIAWDNQEHKYMFWAGMLYAFLPLNAAPFLQRFLMSMNKKQITQALSVIAILDLSIVLTVVLFGFVVMAAGGGVHHSHLLWHVVDTKMWGALKGLFVVGIIAAIMSTADSYLNNAGVLVARDIVKRVMPNISARQEVTAARIATGLTGIIAITLIFITPKIMELVWLSINFYYPTILIPLSAGFLGFRTNSRSFIASTILSVIGVILGIVVQGKCDFFSNIFGIGGSAVGLFGAHYLQKAFGVLHSVARQEQEELALLYAAEAQRLGVPLADVPAMLAQTEKRVHTSHKGLYQWVIITYRTIKNLRLRDMLFCSQRQVERYGERYYEFAVFGLCFCMYPLLFLDGRYEFYLATEHNPLLSAQVLLRMLAGFGCLTIAMQHMWQQDAKNKYMPLYFHFMVMLSLPALSTYTYLVTPDEKQNLTGMVLAIFSLALLVDWQTLIIVSIGGFLFSNMLYCLFAFLLGMEHIYVNSLNGTIIYVVLSFCVAGVLRFIQDQHTNKLYAMATTDALTGLANLRSMHELLAKLVEDAHGRGTPLSIISLDVDHFKRLNDKYGHDVGDIALKCLGQLMLEGARPLDLCARVGGEEFIVILPNAHLYEAEMIAERLRNKIATCVIPISGKPYSISFTVSLGVAQLQAYDTSVDLLKRADQALYLAKGNGDNGRNRVVSQASFYEIEMAVS